METPIKSYVTRFQDSGEQYQKIQRDFESVADEHYKWEVRAIQNRDYYFSDPWSDEEKAIHESQKRHAYSINHIRPVIAHLMGMETNTRMDSICVAREKTDEDSVALLNFIVKWCEQINNIDEIQSQIFESGAVLGTGAALIRWEEEDLLYGYPKIEKVNVLDLYWDGNAEKGDLSDARWVGRLRYLPRLDALEMFPEHKQAIEQAVGSPLTTNIWWKIYHNRFSTTILDERQLVPVGEYYEKILTYTYYVVDGVMDALTTFDSKQEAQDYLDGLLDGYATQGQIVKAKDGTDLVKLRRVKRYVIDQTIFIGDKVIHHKPTLLPMYPFVFFFPHFQDGYFRSDVDFLKDMQDLLNRSFSQYDHLLGSSLRNGVVINKAALDPTMTEELLRQELSNPVPVIFVNGEPGNFIQPLMQQGVNPAIFNMIEYAAKVIEMQTGGREMRGLSTGANTSGKAAMIRAEQGGIGRLPQFDKLKTWRMNVIYQLVWYVKNFMSPGQTLRIIGGDQDVRYVNLTDGVLDTIKEIKYDIQIDETNKSESMKERYRETLKELAQAQVLPIELLQPLMIESSPFPQAVKERLLQYYEFYQQFQAQQSQQAEEEKMRREVERSIQKRQMKEELTANEEIQEIQADTKKRAGKIKQELDNVEEIRQRMDAGSVSPTDIAQASNRINTPEEIGDSRNLIAQTSLQR